MPTVDQDVTAAEYYRRSLQKQEATLQAQEATRKAVKFIAWVVGIFAVVALIGYLVLAVNIISKMNVLVSPASTCQSTGGSDPTC